MVGIKDYKGTGIEKSFDDRLVKAGGNPHHDKQGKFASGSGGSVGGGGKESSSNVSEKQVHDHIVGQGFKGNLDVDSKYEVGSWGAKGELYLKMGDKGAAYINVHQGKMKGLFSDLSGGAYKGVKIKTLDDVTALSKKVGKGE